MRVSQLRSLAAILCLVPSCSSIPAPISTDASGGLSFPMDNNNNSKNHVAANFGGQPAPPMELKLTDEPHHSPDKLKPILIPISSKSNENFPSWMTESLSDHQSSTSNDSNAASPSIDNNLSSNKREPFLVWKKRKGRISLNIQGQPFFIFSPGTIALSSMNENHFADTAEGESSSSSSSHTDETTAAAPELTITTDVAGVVRLALLGARVSFSFLSAFVGTLRLLAPLIVARRGINAMTDTYVDYMTGRYLRTTYNKIEHHYVRTYQIPAALRALGRILVQAYILKMLGNVMEWTVGLSQPPCAHGGGCYWWCGLMWIAAVAGTGHAASTAVAVWVGPLKLQREDPPMPIVRPVRVFTRPWHVLQWMRDPDEWISMMSRPKSFSNYRQNRRRGIEPFVPNRHLFPATWSSIRIIQSLAIARAMSAAARATESLDDNRALRQLVMRSFLIQQCLSDEWHRVLLVERRVALAVLIHIFYFGATFYLVIKLATMDGLATFLMLPSTLAVVVSGWINIYIFWNRMEERRRETSSSPNIIETWNDRREATVKAIQW